ncbi:hypothetical protein GCM10010372_52570 [Streptomyces tauricus]|uniref:hypothetical protein n=1 Tax=Streptomyces tauricus TaxID=68274 RepID=UPI00167B2A82|nr:hypothetical protein [Streptomyces tauricus]GHA46122.1 hypothetical protein GCM10010372_52570 [Streptomyces tauricus]
MTRISVVDDSTEWQEDLRLRLRAFYAKSGLGAEAAERRLQEVGAGSDDWTLAEITDAGTRVGHVAVVVADDNGTQAGRIVDLRVEARHAGRGHERVARDWAEKWCAERGATRLDVRLTESAGELFADYRVRGQLRAKRLGARPMTRAEYPEWLDAEKAAYVGDMVGAARHQFLGRLNGSAGSRHRASNAK